MKTRTGFVSNSSSASFVLYKRGIKESKLNKVRNYKHFADKMNLEEGTEFLVDDFWSLHEDAFTIEGSTWMDNLQMNEYLKAIGLVEGRDFDYRRD